MSRWAQRLSPRGYERFPQAVVQPCIVRLIRNIVAFVSGKDRKAIMPSVKPIYRAENAEAAAARLDELEARRCKRVRFDQGIV
ncbi:MAG: transposase [Hyphomicrobiales bacterium]|nr:transposase [Hyphomicrobiales bacterium]